MISKHDTNGEKNANKTESGKNNHSGGLTGLVNGVNSSNGKGNGTSSVRASTVYDICHPLVM